MPVYTVHYTLAGDPEVPASMEYEAPSPASLFLKLERTAGLSSAELFEDGEKIGRLRRSESGIWQID